MPATKRVKTDYPGVYYITKKDGRYVEKIYYIMYRLNGKLIEEKAGGQFKDDMTPAKASGIRSDRVHKKALPNKKKREIERKEKAGKWTFNKLWDDYHAQKKDTVKGILTDKYRYEMHLKDLIGNKEPMDLVKLDVRRVQSKMGKKVLHTEAYF